MIGLFSVTLSFERSSAFFSSFAFSALAFIIFSDEKKFAKRERKHTSREKSFFHFFRLSSFLQESKKNFFFAPFFIFLLSAERKEI